MQTKYFSPVHIMPQITSTHGKKFDVIFSKLSDDSKPERKKKRKKTEKAQMPKTKGSSLTKNITVTRTFNIICPT